MSKLKDLTGQRFGHLTVLYRVQGTKRTTWHCLCDCGHEIDALSTNLIEGHITACNHCHGASGEKHKGRVSPSFQDLTGQRFGRLTAVLYDPKKRKWVCRCDCGRTVTLACTYLTDGSRTDCGCSAFQAAGERVKEGKAGHINGTNVYTIQHVMDGQIRSTNTSGATGVQVRPLARGGYSYHARITVRGKDISLGSFATMEEAVAARKEAEQKYFAPLIGEPNPEKKAALEAWPAAVYPKGCCIVCGKPIPQGWVSFCSAECMQTARNLQRLMETPSSKRPYSCRWMKCTDCGTIYWGLYNTQRCPDCREKHRKAVKTGLQSRMTYEAERKRGSTDFCQRCGKPYTVTGPLQRYCPECQQLNAQERIKKNIVSAKDQVAVYNSHYVRERRKKKTD